MRKRKELAIFIVIALLQLGVVSSVIFSNYLVLRSGEEVRIIVEPIDPHDVFRGKYVYINIDTVVKKDAKATISDGDKAYLLFKENSDGFATFDRLTDQKPDGGLYMKVKVYSANWENGLAYFENPFERFYIEESYAADAERVAWEHAQEGDVYIKVKLLNGKGVVEDLLIDGTSIKDFVDLQESP
jgi:uncharacterized membrane-anchored protein